MVAETSVAGEALQRVAMSFSAADVLAQKEEIEGSTVVYRNATYTCSHVSIVNMPCFQ